MQALHSQSSIFQANVEDVSVDGENYRYEDYDDDDDLDHVDDYDDDDDNDDDDKDNDDNKDQDLSVIPLFLFVTSAQDVIFLNAFSSPIVNRQNRERLL